MHRLVALLLALLLPLQFAWGAAAVYCGHETTTATAQATEHVGHHAHEHKAESRQDAKKPASAKLAVDNDCAACHATCSVMACDAPPPLAALVLTARQDSPTPSAPTSAPVRAPDRPQWLRLA